MTKTLGELGQLIIQRNNRRTGRQRPVPIPSDPNKCFWGAVPFLAAIARHPGRTDNGHIQWALTGGELRYLITVCCHGQREEKTGKLYCYTSQGTLAGKLGVHRSSAVAYEASLRAKGICKSQRKARKRGQFNVRVLEVLLNAPISPKIESADSAVEKSTLAVLSETLPRAAF